MLPRRLRRLPTYQRDDGLVVGTARSFRARLLGLGFLREPPLNYGLLIPRCRSVHTFGMRFPLELRWLDEQGEVLHVERLEPNRVRRCAMAHSVLELPR